VMGSVTVIRRPIQASQCLHRRSLSVQGVISDSHVSGLHSMAAWFQIGLLEEAMLNLTTGAFKDCSGTTRRQFVQVGGLSMLRLALPDFLRLRQLAAAAGKSGKSPISCIFLWMRGGPSHIDTFDPKPDAALEIRGAFG